MCAIMTLWVDTQVPVRWVVHHRPAPPHRVTSMLSNARVTIGISVRSASSFSLLLAFLTPVSSVPSTPTTTAPGAARNVSVRLNHRIGTILMFVLVWIAALIFWTFDERTSGWLVLPVLGWVILSGAFLHMSGFVDLAWNRFKRHP